MPEYKIQFDPTQKREDLRKLAAKLQVKTPLHKRLGKRLEVTLRAHFLKRNQEPNKRGWPKQNFWARIRRVTAFASADEKGAKVVVVDPALAAKIHGAKNVKPRAPRKWLALPVRPQAYGKRPRVFSQELFFVLRRGKAWLAKKEDRAIRFYYRLLKSVNLPKDPRALPEDSTIQAGFTKTLESYFNQAREGGPGPAGPAIS